MLKGGESGAHHVLALPVLIVLIAGEHHVLEYEPPPVPGAADVLALLACTRA